ncbi:glutathione S-transferase family protein [Limobrevibacterium gyesilva]|uniref:Glutathione S-transferase family protein n=1 Tax=Limobrevibacterium gyesilva TaxID=2991712 RepID=A0AA41YR03_9PROT|nr:glutathione S-transferase family protein [Limobrevibacterium gyesilva]MCW3477131.1 glutathione S-transferase family protein [Limobrevibacterium gyesilva]
MITVYGYTPSGNCWKVATILRLAGRPFRWVEVDSNAGETRTPEFLARNPVGKIPVAELEDGTVLIESNAMLGHFAEGTLWLPAAGLARTRVYEWLFFEQYSHEPYIAVARNIVSFLRQSEQQAVRLEQCRVGGERALDVMERRLAGHQWLTDAGPTIADIALCGYTQVADEGGFELARWPGVSAWLGRMRGLPDIVMLDRAPG